MNKKALIIGSENADKIKRNLEKTGYEAHVRQGLIRGLTAYSEMNPQLVVFDSIVNFGDLHNAVDLIREYEKKSNHRSHIAIVGSHSTHIYDLKASGKVDFIYPHFDKKKLDEMSKDGE
jgi:DNA-binding NtrC family response regulator